MYAMDKMNDILLYPCILLKYDVYLYFVLRLGINIHHDQMKDVNYLIHKIHHKYQVKYYYDQDDFQYDYNILMKKVIYILQRKYLL